MIESVGWEHVSTGWGAGMAGVGTKGRWFRERLSAAFFSLDNE